LVDVYEQIDQIYNEKIKIFITSRVQNYNSAINEITSELFKIEENRFDLSSDEVELYSISDYEELFEKYAIVKQANWVKSFSEYRKEKEKNKNDKSIWSNLNFKNTSPGNINFLFTIYPLIDRIPRRSASSVA